VIKAVLHAEGAIPSPAVRLPLLEASRASVSVALDVLRALSDAPAGILARGASGVQG
jgi:4-hydroxy-tetrahydrodipicolinate synthase